jgi:hypothetical protein
MTDVVGKPILSREDLISAGADFYTTFCEKREPQALNRNASHAPQAPSAYENQCRVEVRYFAAKIYTSRGVHCFDTDLRHPDLRRQLATALRECDPAASEALLVPWPSHSETGWPCVEWASANGLNLDALLYAAAQQRKARAVRLYLNAGADPLRQTYNGDCAARIGIANGMIYQFDRPEWMAGRIQDSGETGLFALARGHDISDLRYAYAMGADPNVENANGQTVFHFLNGAFEPQMREIIAEAAANILRQSTQVATPIEANTCLRRRL